MNAMTTNTDALLGRLTSDETFRIVRDGLAMLEDSDAIKAIKQWISDNDDLKEELIAQLEE